MVWIIAHRGSSGNFPENTSTAFKGAIHAKADVIEFDVQPTKDKKLIILHDNTLDRTTNGYGSPLDFTLTELQKLNAGSWFDEKFNKEKILTFIEAIECIKKEQEVISTNTLMNIELKFYDPKSDWFEKEVIKELEGYESKVAYLAIKFIETYERLREFTNLPIALLQKKRTPKEVIELCKKYKFDFVQIRAKWISKEFIEGIKETGTEVTVFYSDDYMEAKKWIKLGVKGILTNHPEILNK